MALMGREHKVAVEGRDFSALLAGGSADRWEDVAFLRGTGSAPWVCAVTDRYKLVYATNDAPWFVDMKKDPDELNNVFEENAHRPIVRRLTERLIEYGRRHKDHRLGEKPIREAIRAVLQ